MKKTILMSYLALIIVLGFPLLLRGQTQPAADGPEPTAAETPDAETSPEPSPAIATAAAPAPESIKVLTGDGIATMDMQEYLVGVVAAEMPASFDSEALKAQAVAARTYAMYCAAGAKHGEAQVCTDYACCQAWHSDETLHRNWGGAVSDLRGPAGVCRLPLLLGRSHRGLRTGLEPQPLPCQRVKPGDCRRCAELCKSCGVYAAGFPGYPALCPPGGGFYRR